jgi:hypothetical protein
MPNFNDRAEKFLFSKKMGEIVKAEDVDRIVMVTETWMTNDAKTAMEYLGAGRQIADMDDKKEGLLTTYIDDQGVCIDIYNEFEEDEDNQISFYKEQISEEGNPLMQGIFWNVMLAWGLVKVEDTGRRIEVMQKRT